MSAGFTACTANAGIRMAWVRCWAGLIFMPAQGTQAGRFLLARTVDHGIWRVVLLQLLFGVSSCEWEARQQAQPALPAMASG